MAITRRRRVVGYGLDALNNLNPLPISANRAPTANDKAFPGQIWLDTVGNDAYILLEVVNNSASWLAVGSGAGQFDSLNVTNGATIGNTLTVTAGAVTLGALGRGVVQSSAAGVLSSDEGTDGELLIGSAAGAPAWATITSGDGSVVIANGNNTIDLTVSGAAASTFPTDAGTATPALGATTIAGGTNINTSGAAATVTINVDNNPTFSGLVTCQAGITQSAGTTTITSDTDAAQAIYLHANGGTNETVQLHADQGTAATSVYLLSDVGGITLESTGFVSADAININAAAGGVDIDSALQMNIASAQNAADAIVIESTLGGIDILASGASAGEDIDIIATGSSVNITSTENDAGAIYIRANGGASEVVRLHADQGTGAASVHLDSDVGGITLDAGLASDDAINLTASNGGVDIDGAMQINIASSEAAADAILMDASNAAGGIQLQAGTGGILVGNQADCTTIDVGDIAPTASRTITVGGGTVVTAAVTDTIDIGVDGATTNADSIKTVNVGTGAVTTGQNLVNINTGTAASGTQTTNIATGTGGGTKAVNIGNADGLTTLNIDAITLINDSVNVNTSINTGTSTGAVAIGNSAAGAITVDTAAGISLDAATASNFTVTGAADLTLNSTAGAVNITSGEAADDAIVINASDAAGGVQISSGTGDMALTSTGGFITLTSTIDGAGAIDLIANGGTSETVKLTATQGTGTDAIDINATAGGVDVDAALEINLTSAEAAVSDAITLSASAADGGITLDAGATPGVTFHNGTQSFQMLVGSGSPNGVVTASQGSLYVDVAGATGSTVLYCNTNGGNAWSAVGT